MATGLIIAAGAAGALSLGLNLWSSFDEKGNAEDALDLNKEILTNQEEQALGNLDFQLETLTDEYGNAIDTGNLQKQQYTENINRAITQTTEAGEHNRAQATENFQADALGMRNNIENANDDLADLRKNNAKGLSSREAQSAASGVRKSGTVKDTQDMAEADADEIEERGADNIDAAINQYKASATAYKNRADEQKRLSDQQAANLGEDLADYNERYDLQMQQLTDSFNSKSTHLGETRTLIEEGFDLREESLQNEFDSQYTGLSWGLQLTNDILGGAQFGLNIYSLFSGGFGSGGSGGTEKTPKGPL